MLDSTNWLKQPGIIKKLQLFLAISICLNVFLIFNQIPKPKKKTTEIQSEELITPPKEISELEIKNFIKDYLNYFFGTGLVAKSFVEKHTEANLFTSELEAQLDSRSKSSLASNFNIADFYIEPLNNSSFKLILVGIESFVNKEYKDREITMILIIEKQDDNFIVQSIPKFDIKS